MRRPLGYVTVTDPDAPLAEYDSTTCGHCQRIILTKPGSASTVYLVPVKAAVAAGLVQYREEAGAFCRLCMRPICLSCHDHGRCLPWERKIEAREERERWLKAAGVRG